MYVCVGYVETQHNAVNNVTEISISKYEFIPSLQSTTTSGEVLPRLKGESVLSKVTMSRNKSSGL